MRLISILVCSCLLLNGCALKNQHATANNHSAQTQNAVVLTNPPSSIPPYSSTLTNRASVNAARMISPLTH